MRHRDHDRESQMRRTRQESRGGIEGNRSKEPSDEGRAHGPENPVWHPHPDCVPKASIPAILAHEDVVLAPGDASEEPAEEQQG